MRLTFGEQVKIVLSRQGITIKELAEKIEEKTGKKMSRQNLTQRLGRDNFQEQDMYMIAEVLGCTMQVTLMEAGEEASDDLVLSEKEQIKLERKRQRVMEKKEYHEHAGNRDRELTWYKQEQKMREANAHAPTVLETVGNEMQEKNVEQMDAVDEKAQRHANRIDVEENERDITVGELVDIHEELDALEEDGTEISNEELLEMLNKEMEELRNESQPPVQKEEKKEDRSFKTRAIGKVFSRYLKRNEPEIDEEPIHISPEVIEDDNEEEKIDQAIMEEAANKKEEEQRNREQTEENEQDVSDLDATCLNPYTNKEYETNSVRTHPHRIGYVQVYDRTDHKWTDMTEWAFLGYQERKKALLGKDYEQPIYLD